MSWPDHDGATGCADDADERRAEGAGDLGVELVGHHAADVVGLDEGRQVVAERGERHAGEPSGRPRAAARRARCCWSDACGSCPAPWSTGRARAPPCSAQVRCSQRWQDVNSTGDPSVRFIAIRVTRSLPQARQLAPARAPGWVREPRGTCVRDGEAVLVRAMGVLLSRSPMMAPRRPGG